MVSCCNDSKASPELEFQSQLLKIISLRSCHCVDRHSANRYNDGNTMKLSFVTLYCEQNREFKVYVFKFNFLKMFASFKLSANETEYFVLLFRGYCHINDMKVYDETQTSGKC